MAILEFPPVNLADPQGLLAIGGDLEISSLKLAYSQGIYPWPASDAHPIPWFSPDPRGVLFFKDLKISLSLKKVLKKNIFKVQFNSDFERVILACANAKRKDNGGTWLTKNMIEAYINFHYAGFAYSVETLDENDNLVGGVYGVNIGNFVSGESMFYLKPNASKVALVSLMNFLHQKGIEWLDTQMVTPVVASLGGIEISREKFLTMLNSSVKKSSGKLISIFPQNFK